MKKSRYTEEQIIGILKQHEAGVKTADLCREHGISAATFYGWKQKFGGMDVSEAQRLKAMEVGNRRLKLLVAELSLRGEALKAVFEKRLELAGLRGDVAFVSGDSALSERARLQALGVEQLPGSEPRPGSNTEFRGRVGATGIGRSRATVIGGYTRLAEARGRHEVNVKRSVVYVEERLMVRRKRRKRLVRERAAECAVDEGQPGVGDGLHRRWPGDWSDGAHPQRGGCVHARVPGAGSRHQPRQWPRDAGAGTADRTSVAGPKTCVRTTGPSSLRGGCWPGRRTGRSAWFTSSQVVRCRTATSRASTAACAMSASTQAGSGR